MSTHWTNVHGLSCAESACDMLVQVQSQLIWLFLALQFHILAFNSINGIRSLSQSWTSTSNCEDLIVSTLRLGSHLGRFLTCKQLSGGPHMYPLACASFIHSSLSINKYSSFFLNIHSIIFHSFFILSFNLVHSFIDSCFRSFLL